MPYADELGDETLITFSRKPPEGWPGHTGHIDASLIEGAGVDSGTAFACGSDGFVEAATGLLLGVGFEPRDIRTERFGRTG